MRLSLWVVGAALTFAFHANASGSNCPLGMYGDAAFKSEQHLLDPIKNSPWQGAADDFPYATAKIGGTFDPIRLCSRSTIEYEIRPTNEILAGVPTQSSAQCQGNCSHAISLLLPPMTALHWQWRAKIDYYCFDAETGQCFATPSFSQRIAWRPGEPKFRHYGAWTPSPGIDHFIDETFIESGTNLGDESEDNWTHAADGIAMRFGSKPISGTSQHKVQWLAPVRFEGSEYIGAEFRSATITDRSCHEVIAIENFDEGQNVVVWDGTIEPNTPSVRQRKLIDLAGWLQPRKHNFNQTRDVVLHYSCTSDQPFNYGADFVAMTARNRVEK
ncbi:hypothetical protein MF410_31125 (plasmid) [Rhizobium sp. C104]|uniref:hypothetical protein n=1 Tax=Rhizobium sp. C104 TaxID=2917727 RepID=UPI001EF84A06|nr:hypothetical protein [Rhizobium sp. C104]ULJ81878.1 hypothetical protein MF410_31125 [Rhizobium sp. C104]